MDEMGPIDAILLGSSDGKFQVRLSVGSDGSLRAELLARGEDDKYQPLQGIGPAGLAITRRGPRGEIIQFAPPG